MITRRSFLKSSALTAAACLFLKQNTFALPPSELKLGFISGIIGKELEGDWKAALSKCVEYGFSEIEIGKYLGESASEFMDFCRKIGLMPVSGTIPFSEDPNLIEKSLSELSKLEIKHPVISSPWKSKGPYKLEECKQSAAILNKIGEICKNHGMQLCWHNHTKEFISMEQGLPFDFLMANTSKGLVNCELDVFEAAKGGVDPEVYLKKYKGRYRMLHLKDMSADEKLTFECVGNGIIDFQSIITEARVQGIEHFMVECDNIADGMACLASSGEYLRTL